MGSERKPLVVGFDLDGVVVDWHGGLLKKLPEKYHVPLEAVHDWDIYKVFPEESHDHLTMALREPGLYDFNHMDIMPGAKAVMERLYHDPRFHPFICSSPETNHRRQASWSEKARWTATHLGEHWVKRLILASDKSLVRCDVIVDDKTQMVGHNIANYGEDALWERFVFEQPYNKTTPGTRVNWSNIEQRLIDLV